MSNNNNSAGVNQQTTQVSAEMDKPTLISILKKVSLIDLSGCEFDYWKEDETHSVNAEFSGVVIDAISYDGNIFYMMNNNGSMSPLNPMSAAFEHWRASLPARETGEATRWVKAYYDENDKIIGLPPLLNYDQFFIKYNDVEKETGGRNLIIDLLESGWKEVWWLSESIPQESREECLHLPLIDTGVGYYFCPACKESWTVSEWEGKSGKSATPTASVEERAKEYESATPHEGVGSGIYLAGYHDGLAGAAAWKGAEGGFAEWASEDGWIWYAPQKIWAKGAYSAVWYTTSELYNGPYQQYLKQSK